MPWKMLEDWNLSGADPPLRLDPAGPMASLGRATAPWRKIIGMPSYRHRNIPDEL